MVPESLGHYLSQPGSRVAVTGLQAELTEFLATLTIVYSAGYTIEGDKVDRYLGVVNFLHYPREYFAECERVTLRYGLDWGEVSQECVCVPWEDLSTDVNYMFLAKELELVQWIMVIDFRGLLDWEIKAKLELLNKHSFVYGNCRLVAVLDPHVVAELTFYREFDLTVTVIRNVNGTLNYRQVVKESNLEFWPLRSTFSSPLWADRI